tara:strand:- start:1416 stop:1613 length:198 start_codon:yes stop_codon:yes gene_type:complete
VIDKKDIKNEKKQTAKKEKNVVLAKLGFKKKSSITAAYIPLVINRYIYYISRHLPHRACPTTEQD